MSGWYCVIGGLQRGPLDEATLLRLIAEGQVQGDDLLWCEGQAGWRAMKTIPAFAPVQPGSASASVAMPTVLRPAAGSQIPGPRPVELLGYYRANPNEVKEQGRAGMSLALGILGLFTPCMSPLMGAGAIVLARAAMKEMREQRNESRRGVAVAGLVLGVIDIVSFGFVVLLLMSA